MLLFILFLIIFPYFKENSYIFNVHKANSKRIVLNIIDGDKNIRIQLKNWQPTVEECGVPYIEFKNRSSVELLNLKDMNSLYLRSKHKDHFDKLFGTWDNVSMYCIKNRKYF